MKHEKEKLLGNSKEQTVVERMLALRMSGLMLFGSPDILMISRILMPERSGKCCFLKDGCSAQFLNQPEWPAMYRQRSEGSRKQAASISRKNGTWKWEGR